MSAGRAGPGAGARLGVFYRRHEGFFLVLLLFVVFRLLAIWLMRPGGFIADASDYDFYQDWGTQAARGYRTFETLWTAYPPLFPRLMLPVYELSARIPPWVDPRLAFHVLFGTLLLLFETGNLILIYRLAGKLAADEIGRAAAVGREGAGDPFAAPFAEGPGVLAAPLHPVLFYALLFVPVHTLLGWFEAMPLFFLLLGLDLLLGRGRWSWIASAVAVALGFLVKLTPMILIPVAVRWLGARLSWQAARTEWFNRRSPANLLRPALYVAVAAVTALGVGYWLVGGSTALAFSSFRVNSIRPPWQSLWAILDGYWGYGWVPLDMRNLDGLSRTLWETRLPWMWITMGFLALYLLLYVQRYDWERPRTAIGFTGVSAIWMFLYSKGWSPQFLVWVLAFLALLMPGGRGVLLAIALSLINVVESYIYLILLPGERWILVGTVILRTLLLIAVAAEFLGQIWPAPRRAGVQRAARIASVSLLLLTVALGAAGAPRMASAYGERRLAENPCADAVRYLQQQAIEAPLTARIATTEIEVWRNLYPWLRNHYDLRVIDSYTSNDAPVDAVVSERLIDYVGQEEFWWVYTARAPEPTPQNLSFFDEEVTRTLERSSLGECTVERVIRLPDGSLSGGFLASAHVPAGPKRDGGASGNHGAIELQQVHVGAPQPGQPLPLVLYWQATGPILDSWTVFTQLFDGTGALVAQQDNLPVRGLAPTNTWEPYHLIRDPYSLAVAPDAQPGPYTVLIGLYDAAGARAPLTLADGTTADALEIAAGAAP